MQVDYLILKWHSKLNQKGNEGDKKETKLKESGNECKVTRKKNENGTVLLNSRV